MYSVLFVCTANICRSPMAMGLMRARVSDQPGEWRIESAGTWTIGGEPAASRARLVLEEKGIDLSKHRSRQVSADMLQEFNLILVMEQGHKEALQVEFPEIASRVYLLTEMVGSFQNIEDPIGRSLVDFETTTHEIDQILANGFEKISQLAAM